MPFPHYTQLDAMPGCWLGRDCGPIPIENRDKLSLRIVARYHGKHYNVDTLRERSFIPREGVSPDSNRGWALAVPPRGLGCVQQEYKYDVSSYIKINISLIVTALTSKIVI